ncbi:phenylacrylic acid decarboxylase [Aspergillus terreus]|nr:phenylacrylic acid decarboxylase [Aspergillus terreus]
MEQEVRSVLGLQNTFNTYPFMDAGTADDRWKELVQIVPQRTEVLRFFQFYRQLAYPFNPILVDIDRFELDLCTYLNAYAAGVFEAHSRSEKWATDQSIAHISLLLATLSAGAHFSDLDLPQRSNISHDLALRSFKALRLANFLFRPSLDIIQTLLILGNTLQNHGQSDAAWAQLGTTVRLAQTMGLHTERSIAYLPLSIQSKAKALWLGINVTTADRDAQETAFYVDMLNHVDEVYQRALPHLTSRANCKSMHEHLEHLALKMHLSLLIGVLTRPALKQPQTQDSSYGILRERAKTSMIDASRAFLDFQALSVIPLRTWSMVHTALTSTLLLSTWEETRNDPESRDLQQRVIELFSAVSSVGQPGDSAPEYGPWLSKRHIRALITLRNTVRYTLDQEREVGVFEENPTPSEIPLPAFDLPPGFPEAVDQVGASPVSYLDSIMNVPLFDFSQETRDRGSDAESQRSSTWSKKNINVGKDGIYGLTAAHLASLPNNSSRHSETYTTTAAMLESIFPTVTTPTSGRTSTPSSVVAADHDRPVTSTQTRRRRIVVAMTGATGAIMGIKVLLALRRLNIETHLVMSKWAEATIKYETDYHPSNVKALADHVHNINDMAAPISSGSFRADGMIVVPCSMKTLAAIHSGFCDDLISRTADVMLKERRRLVLVARETPLSEIHLRNMLEVTRAGAIIFPPVPAFYIKAAGVDDLVDQSVGRMLDLFGLDTEDFDRWNGWEK